VPDQTLRASALAHLQTAPAARRDPAHGVALREKPLPALIDLRLDPREVAPAARVQDALGLELPEMGRAAVAGGIVAYRLGPDEGWIASDGPAAELEAKLREALGPEVHAAVTEIGEGWAQIEVSGPRARDLLAKGCPLDFHPSGFAVGEVKQSLMAKADCVYRLVADGDDGPVFELTVRRSFADYAWRWLHDAAGEYGVSVVA
jgi:sarcosine oxidase subunit gamma